MKTNQPNKQIHHPRQRILIPAQRFGAGFRRWIHGWLFLSFLVSSVVAQAQSTPPPPAKATTQDPKGTRALRRDITRIVEAEDLSGWLVDSVQLQKMYPTLLESICRASLTAREQAMTELQQEQDKAGDPKTLFENNHRAWSSKVRHALQVSREVMALSEGLKGAGKDCPFWLEPKAGFVSRQTNLHQFSLSLESGGLIQLRQTQDQWTYGGGGVIRLMAGYGISPFLTWMVGAEFGGGAMLRIPREDKSEFVINYFPALPMVFRFHSGSWYYDAELAGVTLFQSDDSNISYGGRLGFGLGVMALRTKWFLPWAGISLAYEHYLESDGRPAAHFLRGGLRVGALWLP
jgi:hypothetical protein